MARPRFEVVDDPLAVTRSDDERETSETRGSHERAEAPRVAKRARTTSRSRTKASARSSTAVSENVQVERSPLSDPPALDEPLTLVAARLPRSLDRALDEHTQQLRRARDGASQKKLPKQEVLAMAVWALGDPDDEQAVARVEALYEEYRGRRLAAAAAAALENSRASLARD